MKPADPLAVQDRYAPRSTCFGCGPANEHGLRLKSRVEGDELGAQWRAGAAPQARARPHTRGIAGTLIDCHSNWAAALHLMRAGGADRLPSTVTAELNVRFLRPAPTAGPITLRAHVVEATGRSATVESSLEAGGEVCAIGRARFVAVGPEHPAFGRWEGD